MKIPPLVVLGLLLALCRLPAAELSWHPGANMDSQLFPSLVIATATVRPDEEENNDPEVLGDAYGAVGVSIKSPAPNTKVRVTVLENIAMNKSSWSGVLEKADVEYYIAPKVSYKFEQLRKVQQQVPLNVTFAVEVGDKSVGEQSETLTLRSINDCPFGVSDAEETIDPENVDDKADEEKSEEPEESSGGGYNDMGWMFAAYVNESSPIVDKILKEALATGIVDHFGGYQGDRDDVLREIFAVWSALQDRGIKYSNITTTPGSSPTVYSQHVRFVDESLANEQANCVDGSVLFCSILRKLGLRSFLVAVPGHMYMGVYLAAEGDDRLALETTLIGATVAEDADISGVTGLEEIHDALDEEIAEGDGWKSFVTALVVGSQNLSKNHAKFEAADDPQFQIIDIDESRKDGIMPISYMKAE